MFNYYALFADAVVSFVMDAYDVGEEAGSVSICVDSGVTEGFQAELVVALVAIDGKASEYWYCDFSTKALIVSELFGS